MWSRRGRRRRSPAVAVRYRGRGARFLIQAQRHAVGSYPADRGRRCGDRRRPRRQHLRHRSAHGQRAMAGDPRRRLVDSRARGRPTAFYSGSGSAFIMQAADPATGKEAVAHPDGQRDVRRRRKSRRRARQQRHQWRLFADSIRRRAINCGASGRPTCTFRARSRRGSCSPARTTVGSAMHSRPAAHPAQARSLRLFLHRRAGGECVLVQARGQERDPRRVPGRLFQHGQSRLCPGTRLASYERPGLGSSFWPIAGSRTVSLPISSDHFSIMAERW